MLDVTNQLEILHTAHHTSLPASYHVSTIISIAAAISLQASHIQVITHDLTPFPFPLP